MYTVLRHRMSDAEWQNAKTNPFRCITDTSLSKLANKLVVSFVYSHDVVTRLSLGSVRDLRNAAMWLCEAENGE